MMVHIQYTSSANRAMMSPFRLENVTYQTIFFALALQCEALNDVEITHCRGTLPGSRRMACVIDHTKSTKTNPQTTRKMVVGISPQGCRSIASSLVKLKAMRMMNSEMMKRKTNGNFLRIYSMLLLSNNGEEREGLILPIISQKCLLMIHHFTEKIRQMHAYQFARINAPPISLYNLQMKKGERKPDSDKSTNYKNLLTQYYDKDNHLSDVRDQVRAITPEIDILDELTDFEKKIDALIKTKRYDVQEMYMKPPQKLKRLLRVKVARNTEQGQELLKVFGYIYPRREETAACRFTSFFRQMTLVSEKDKTTLETWKKPTNNFQERDGLVVRLPGTSDEGLSVHLTLISNPPRFEVDPLLERIVGLRTGTRVQVLDAFWLYVKTKKLQDVQNKEIINADDLIRQAFKTEKLTFATINHRVRELLIPVEPIRIALAPNENQKVYDIIVEIEEKPNVDIVPFFSQKLNEEKNDHPFLSLVGKIKKCENKFRDHAQKLRRHLLKRDFYKNFKAEKVEDLIVEQQKLLQELKKNDPSEDYNKLEYILENEDELEKEIKHYFESITTGLIN